jgi:hypothetical protein
MWAPIPPTSDIEPVCHTSTGCLFLDVNPKYVDSSYLSTVQMCILTRQLHQNEPDSRLRHLSY